MRMYNFKRLIEKYSVTFCLHKTQGGYVAGKWEESGTIVKSMKGAIVPMSDRKIYQSGGTYTQQDRELYLSEALRGDLSQLKVDYKQNTYTVEESRDYGDYADVAVYVLRRVDAHA